MKPYLALATLLLCSVARSGSASDASEAEASFNAGIKAYDHKSYEEALKDFELAFSLKPSHKILYNIGLSAVMLHDPARALDAFEGYMAGGMLEGRVEQVRKAVEQLRTQVGDIVLDDTQAQSKVSVDGRLTPPRSGERPMHANPGEHRVCVEDKPGSQRCRLVTVVAGSQVAVRFSESREPPLSVSSPLADPPRPDTTARWVAWSAAGALAATAVLTGVLALDAHGTEQDLEKTRGVTRGDLDDAHSKTSNLALATDLLAAGAAVSVGVALYLQLSSGHGTNEAPRSSARLMLRPNGVTFALRF